MALVGALGLKVVFATARTLEGLANLVHGAEVIRQQSLGLVDAIAQRANSLHQQMAAFVSTMYMYNVQPSNVEQQQRKIG